MRHFATESGKSKGQFYTPAEVSRIMAKVIAVGSAKSASQTIYDPTCGSGSLLLKAHDEARGRTGYDLALYGQEMDNATAALARMNTILHDCPTAEIWKDNVLANPHWRQASGLKTFDFVVANPPFSFKAWSSGFNPAEDEFRRFELGIPPAKNGDHAFLLHILTSLKSTGKAAVNLPHGVLFRGGAEADIRRQIVKRGYIQGIIGLPPNLFYGTGIPACILVLNKEDAAGRKGIFMVDASKGFVKDGNKNRLRAQDIHKIVDAFTRQLDLPRFSRMVPLAEVEANDFNLNLPRYIDSTEPEDLQDIDAHLRGGIPDRDIDALERYWRVFPEVRATLFKKADRKGYSQLKVAVGEVKAAIFGHAEFAAFNQAITALFAKWKKANAPRLHGIAVGIKPKALIETLAESLLDTFREAPLLDPYDVYQHLLDSWAATMQDDAYLIAQEGWKAVLEGKPNADLIPEALIVARFFAADQAAVEKLEADRDAVTRQMEEMDEEHGGEDGLLAEARTEKGKLTAKGIKERLKAIEGDEEATEERKLLNDYIALSERESAASKQVKEAQRALEAKVAAKYGKLTEVEIKTLVVDDKWLTSLAAAVQSELDRVSQALTGRIRELAERYATPLPKLTAEVETLAARVGEHLKRMGAACMQKLLTGQTRMPGFQGVWKTWRFSDLFEFLSTANNPRADLSEFGDVGYVHYGDVHTSSSAFLDCAQAALPRISSGRIPGIPCLRDGDLVVVDASEDYAGIGKSVEILHADGRNVVAGLHTLLLRGHRDLLADGFKGYLQFIPMVKASLIRLATGISVFGVSKRNVASIEVNLPGVEEQRAIVAVLSDMDAELAALEARRDKTRALKQGMMQELLTGRIRLV